MKYEMRAAGTVSVDELLALLAQAHTEVSALCNGKRWRMSIPVEHDDSDMVIGDALRHAAAFVKAYAAKYPDYAVKYPPKAARG